MNNKCVFLGCVYKPEGNEKIIRLNIHPGTRNFEVRFLLTNYFGQLRATAF